MPMARGGGDEVLDNHRWMKRQGCKCYSRTGLGFRVYTPNPQPPGVVCRGLLCLPVLTESSDAQTRISWQFNR